MNTYLKQSASINKINDMAQNNLTSLVINSEEIYKNQIERLMRRLFALKKLPKAIFLSGPSSSGKTTSSKLIRNRLEKAGISSIVISLDDFFVDRVNTPRFEDGSFDFENINSIDLDYFNKFLNDLLETNNAKMPLYDFFSGTRKPNYVDICIDDNTIVIFEGIHALNPLLMRQDHKDDVYKIYVCLNTDFIDDGAVSIPAQRLRLMRRMIRDHYTRGFSIPSTLELWQKVLDGEEKWIKPFKDSADFLIDSTHLYEPNLYATYLHPLLEKVEDNPVADECLAMLNQCVPLTKDCVPTQSLLWEFLVY